MTLAVPALIVLALTFVPFDRAPLLSDGVTVQLSDTDLQLVLAADVSNSMSTEQLRMQRNGYVDALRDPLFVSAIKAGERGRIAVMFMEWAGPDHHLIAVPWTVIEDRSDALAVADMLSNVSLTHTIKGNPGTSISAAIAFAAAQFPGSPGGASRRVIDISGDGANNAGAPVVAARDRVLALGITINGLPIEPGIGKATAGRATGWLPAYFESCVIGGPGAFSITAHGPSQFGAAIRRKLLREILARAPIISEARVIRRAPFDCSSPGEQPGR